MIISDFHLYLILQKRLGESKASELVRYVVFEAEKDVHPEKEILATKEDLTNVHHSIYVVGFVQFLAIIGSVITIINFMIK